MVAMKVPTKYVPYVSSREGSADEDSCSYLSMLGIAGVMTVDIETGDSAVSESSQNMMDEKGLRNNQITWAE